MKLKKLTGWLPSLLGALFIGALNTVGDLIWDNWIRSHRLYFGVLHGALLCAAMGLVFGLVSGAPGTLKKGPLFALAIGVVSAASYYLFATWLGFWAMLLSWCLLWLLFAWLQQILGTGARGLGWILVRGFGAGILSGLAFYAIVDIWRHPSPHPNYWYHFGAWSIAFFPGFLVLFLHRSVGEQILKA